jgi:MFS family permease
MQLKPRYLTPALSAVIAEGFLSRLSFGIISFALPLYARRLGLSLTETGFLFSLNLIAEQVMKPGMGWAVERFGLKRSFTTAIGLRSLIALLLAFAGAPWQIYAIRIAHGVAESLRDPSVNTLIAENADKKSLASSYAWYSTAKTVAGSLGKGASGILLTLTAYNYSSVFIVAFALSVLPLYTVARYIRDERATGGSEVVPTSEAEIIEQTEIIEQSEIIEQISDVEAPAAEQKRPASILPMVVLGFLISGTANMIHSLFPVLATEYGGLTPAETGVIYTVSILVTIFAGPLFGWLSDNVSRRLVLLIRGACNTLSSLVFLFFPTFWGLAAGRVADDCGKAAFRPAWGALMAYVSGIDRRRRVRTISYLSMGEGLGEIAGPILAGFLWSAWSIPVMLGARVLLALVSEFYAMIVAGPLEKMEGYSSSTGGRTGRFAHPVFAFARRKIMRYK